MTSRLDFCNSLLVNHSASQILRLQRVQNNAARLITRTSRHDHIIPAYRCVNGLAPTYLVELLHIRTPDGRLRKDYAPTLHQCITKKSIGESAFGTTAPRLWNSLPADIRNSKTLTMFRKSLKTHLFTSHFKYEENIM